MPTSTASTSPAAAPDPAPAPSPALLNGPLLVLVAMPEEAEPLIARLDGARDLETPFATGVTAWRGRLAGADTVVVTTGIGIAAASAAATWGILATAPGLVVAAGSCGGLAADVEVGTLIVGETFTYSIADATAFGYAPGQVPGGPERFEAVPARVDAAEQAALRADGQGEGRGVRRGLMLSGDAFVTAEIAAPMRERFPTALSADMETTASARTAEALGVPFVALRAVSDLCGPAAGQQFHLALAVVSAISAPARQQLAASRAR
ncbi:MAG: 5'-methylthioadenosine/S-adenosylhomocysteine nucleosidase [Brachybacterium sp.]|nr:5'-methylthioadenosine/S-adenosylhomocysteine nucleosidase [Brachybacterium sp.]